MSIPLPFDGQAATSRPHQPQWRVLFDGTDTPVLDGQVRKNLTTWPGTTLDLKLSASPLPATPAGLLLPFGTEVVVQWRVLPVAAWTTIAHGVVTRSQIDRPDGQWNLEAVDRSAVVSVDVFDQGSWTPPPGMTVADLVTYITHRTYPGFPINASGAVTTTPVSDDLVVRGDPWSAVADAVDSAGGYARFTPDGAQLVVTDAPTIGTPTLNLTTGDGGTITGYSAIFERAYNRAYITFTDPANPTSKVYGRWTLSNPASPLDPTNLGTNVGYYEEREGTPSQTEADLAAAALGNRLLGRGQSSRLRHVPAPWLEPGDTISVDYAPGISQNYLVVGVTIPLGADEQETVLLNSDYVGPLTV
jgi:hypothetical protein